MISFRCPCGHGWTANPEGGRKAACPKCGRSVLSQPAAAKPPARSLQGPRTPPPMLPPPTLPPVPRPLRGPGAKTFAAILVAMGLFPVSLALVVGTWTRSSREHNGTSYALVNPRDPRRVMLVPTSAWDLARQDPRESFDRLFVWGGGAVGGVCGLLGIFLLGYGLSHPGESKGPAPITSKPAVTAASQETPVQTIEAWLCVDNTGEAPLEVRLDDDRFELAPWTIVKRPLADGKRRLVVASAGATLFEKEFKPRAGVVYLCDPLKNGCYVTWTESYYCDGHEFIRYAFGRDHRDEYALGRVDWVEIVDGIPPGDPVPKTAKENCSRTVLRKRAPDPFPPTLADWILSCSRIDTDVWDGDVRDLALRARATGGK